eukprot:6320942-Alexandrium_andersonii.AAC.1
MGKTTHSAAPNRRKSETTLPHCQAHEAPRFARCLLRVDLRNGSEPWRGPLCPLGVLGQPPPRAGFWAQSSLWPDTK